MALPLIIFHVDIIKFYLCSGTQRIFHAKIKGKNNNNKIVIALLSLPWVILMFADGAASAKPVALASAGVVCK
jgi:hypothetical protein